MIDINKIVAEVELLKATTSRSNTARLRDIFDAVDSALNAGVRRTELHALLCNHGFDFKLRSFDAALYRIRRKRKRSASADSSTHPVLPPRSAKELALEEAKKFRARKTNRFLDQFEGIKE